MSTARGDVQSADGICVNVPGVGVMFIVQPSAPVNAAVGYGPGCTWLNTGGGVGTLQYENVGTFASAQWLPVDNAYTALVSATATLAVTRLLHAGRTIVLNALAGFTSTLPAATGSGLIYRFVIGAVNTSNAYIINTSPTTDIFQGTVFGGVTAAATGKCWTAGATDNTITLNGTTTGGASIGDSFQVQDIAAGIWAVQNDTITSIVGGGLATPFSHV